ncbi:uncharacterized protein [Amphiura filiformis]|uniref:uncharacterized protein isoform X2 n=1 Tax=Amphiura filiformis TaxID=82378 RepID=UPI003B20FB7D
MEEPDRDSHTSNQGEVDRKRHKKHHKIRAKCCGDVGCTKFCMGKVSKHVRKKLKRKVKEALSRALSASDDTDDPDDPEEAHKFVLQFMRGCEISNFGSRSKHRKKVSWTYFIPAALPKMEDFQAHWNADDIEKVEVCQRAFLEVFGINERFIRTAREVQSKTIRGEEVKPMKRKLRKKKLQNVANLRQQVDDGRQAEMLLLKSMYNWDNFEITDETLQGLVDEGFTSLLSISSIREDDLKYLKRTTGIKQGQVALLRQAVAAIGSSTISACKALVQALHGPEDQENTSIEVHFESGGGEVAAIMETSSDIVNPEPGTAILECRNVSPEPGPSRQDN